ncbi:MAG TPA: hypothetical protein DD618_04555 [Acholeplasmatales bacterium]|nr:hypothetical protein [Acholeplasmatales bacterium]
MIDTKDYRAYLKQNREWLQMLKANQSIVYERLEDVFNVLEDIDERAAKYAKIEEEYEVIFEAGFLYLHKQLETAKTIYSAYFHNDYFAFRRYEKAVNYLLYLDDLEDVLDEKEKFHGEIKDLIRNTYEKIENIIAAGGFYDDSVLDESDVVLLPYLKGILTTIEVYALVAEEMEIQLK